MLDYGIKVLGFAGIFATAFSLGQHRSRINVTRLFVMFAAQWLLALFMLKTASGLAAGQAVARVFSLLYAFADQGGQMVFGGLNDVSQAWGFIFAVKVTTLITFLGGLMALLSYWGVIGQCVRVIAWITTPLFGVSGAEGLCAVANSLLGQIEAPMLVQQYLNKMTRSEMMVVMISGFSTMSVTLLVAFAAQGISALHLFTSSIMSVPGSLLIAKLMQPEIEKPETLGQDVQVSRQDAANAIDAVATGAMSGFRVAGIVMAMLIVFVAGIALVNAAVSGAIQALFGLQNITIDTLLGFVLRPISWVLGITDAEQISVASLIGHRMIINEFVSYLKMLTLNLSDYSQIMLTYLLCGFANISSIGIQVGGIGAIAPDRRKMLTEIGMRAMLGGTLVNILNALIVSCLL